MTDGMRIVLDALCRSRFSLEDEKKTQYEIGLSLGNVLGVRREVIIAGGIIDFVAGRVGIEVKIKGSGTLIRRQLARYAEDAGLDGLVLVTAKPVALPATMNGKPLATVNLSKAWL